MSFSFCRCQAPIIATTPPVFANAPRILRRNIPTRRGGNCSRFAFPLPRFVRYQEGENPFSRNTGIVLFPFIRRAAPPSTNPFAINTITPNLERGAPISCDQSLHPLPLPPPLPPSHANDPVFAPCSLHQTLRLPPHKQNPSPRLRPPFSPPRPIHRHL